MRYAVFLVLVLLTLYFSFVKPFLATKGLEYKLRLEYLSLSPLALHIEEFYFYLPFKDTKVFLRLSEFRIKLEGKPEFYLKEGTLNILTQPSKIQRKKEEPKLYIPEFAKGLNLKVESFIVNVSRGSRTTSILIKDLVLKDARASAYVEITTPKLSTRVNLTEALLKEDTIEIRYAKVSSELFDFVIRARTEEGGQKATFTLEGRVNPIDKDRVLIKPIKILGFGELTYKGIKAKFEGFTEEVLVKGRKSFTGIYSEGNLELLFGKKLTLTGFLKGKDISGEYNIQVLPSRLIEVNVHEFLVDSELLRLKAYLKALAKGKLVYNMETGVLRLHARTDKLRLEHLAFSKAEVSFEYNLIRREGNLELFAKGDGNLHLRGKFVDSGFSGDIYLDKVPLKNGRVSALLTHRGKLIHRGGVYLSGQGNLKETRLGELRIRTISYRLSLEKDRLFLNLWGKGLKGHVRGNLGRHLVGSLSFENFTLETKDLVAHITRGGAWLSVSKESTRININVGKAYLALGAVKLPLEGSANLLKEDTLKGSFNFFLPEVRLGRLTVLRGLMLKGSLEEDKVEGAFISPETLNGSFVLNIRKKSMLGTGTARFRNFHMNYEIRGAPDDWLLISSVHEQGEQTRKILSSKVSYRNGVIEALFLPESYKYGVFELLPGRVSYRGTLKDGSLSIEESALTAFGKPLIRTVQKIATYSKGKLFLEFELSGSVEGRLRFVYDEDGYHLRSTGRIDMEKLSFFTATPAGGRLVGYLRYELSFERGHLTLKALNDGDLITYSRFLSHPMDLHVELRAFGKDLSAFLELHNKDSTASVNVGSTDLKNYYVYISSQDLPVTYRNQRLWANLRVSSQGWVDVKNLQEVKLTMKSLFTGDITLFKVEDAKRDNRKGKLKLELDLEFESYEPIRLSLPEGYVYARVRGWVRGKLPEPDYTVEAELLSGELSYFGKTFFLREGNIRVIRREGIEEREIDISLVNPSEEENIFLTLKGPLENPDIFVWSEPPRSMGEILTSLIVGSTAEGLIPVTKALLKELGYAGDIKRDISALLGIDISLFTRASARGELGFGINIKKRIGRIFSVEYQQSTLRNPRETYYGGGFTFPGGIYLYGRVFSDNTTEVKLRVIKKFDF